MTTKSATLTVSAGRPWSSLAALRRSVADLSIDGWCDSTKLLTIGNPKTEKNTKVGDFTAVLHLAPARLSGRDVCPWRSEGCTAACLHTAGYLQFQEAKTRARIARTHLFFLNRPLFLAIIEREIRAHIRKAERLGLNASVRLNGTSDLPWECYGLMERFGPSEVRFYDYTKSWQRAVEQPYHLTFSRSENNDDHCRLVLAQGGNVTVVVGGYGISVHPKPLPATSSMFGDEYEVIDGDEHDARYLDRPSSIVALRAKGDAIGDTSGFVVSRQLFEGE